MPSPHATAACLLLGHHIVLVAPYHGCDVASPRAAACCVLRAAVYRCVAASCVTSAPLTPGAPSVGVCRVHLRLAGDPGSGCPRRAARAIYARSCAGGPAAHRHDVLPHRVLRASAPGAVLRASWRRCTAADAPTPRACRRPYARLRRASRAPRVWRCCRWHKFHAKRAFCPWPRA